MKFNVFLFNVYKRFLFLSRFLRFLTFFYFNSNVFLHLCNQQQTLVRNGHNLRPLTHEYERDYEIVA